MDTFFESHKVPKHTQEEIEIGLLGYLLKKINF